MLVYPSSESYTDHKFWPLASLILSIAACCVYIFAVFPEMEAYSKVRSQKRSVIVEHLTEAYAEGRLPRGIYLDLQRNVYLLDLPENQRLVDFETQEAFRNYESVPLPLRKWYLEGRLKRLLPIIAPTELFPLLWGVCFLFLAGYVFEHIFDRVVWVGLFSIIGVFWVIAAPYIRLEIFPSPILAWANTTAALVFVAWISAPKEKMTFTIHVWFFKLHNWTLDVPLFILPFLCLAGFGVFYYQFSTYSAGFSPVSLISPAIVGLLGAIPLFWVRTRDDLVDNSPEAVANRSFVQVEILFSEEKPDEAIALLRKILAESPSNYQTRRVAEYAFQHHHSQLTQEAYHRMLREAVREDDFDQIYRLVEEMLNLNLDVPPGMLTKTMEICFKRDQLRLVRELLPHIWNGDGLKEQTIEEITDTYTRMLLKRKDVDRGHLFDLRQWYENNHRHSDTLTAIDVYLEKHRDYGGGGAPIIKRDTIHRFVDVEILDISRDKVVLRPEGSEQQSVPWSAFMGACGCYISGGDGYRGCLMIRFKKKVFGCDVKHGSISGERFRTFEEIWEQLAEHMPPDLPFMPYEAFPELHEGDDFQKMVATWFEEQNTF